MFIVDSKVFLLSRIDILRNLPNEENRVYRVDEVCVPLWSGFFPERETLFPTDRSQKEHLSCHDACPYKSRATKTKARRTEIQDAPGRSIADEPWVFARISNLFSCRTTIWGPWKWLLSKVCVGRRHLDQKSSLSTSGKERNLEKPDLVWGGVGGCDREPGWTSPKKVKAKYRIKPRKTHQKKYYSGKKKRHTIKSQVLVDKATQKILCTSFCPGKKHDFRLWKESQVHIPPKTSLMADTGYMGIKKQHANSHLPHKRRKQKKLSKEQKQENQHHAKKRALNEHVIGRLKRFKILSDRYRNRRKRFGLRFNLIAGIHNFELLG